MIICKYFVWFIIYSFLGWIYESIFCTIKGHKWENRGFLYGPIVPIYGVGALLTSIIFSELPVHSLQQASNLKVFLVCFLGSIVLEYSTSWILEKLFHAYWWDYSDIPLNINGRVCLPASLGFGVAGLIVVNFVLPLVRHMTGSAHPLLLELLALVLMLLFGMDLALTVSALTNFAKNFARIENEINEQLTIFYDNLEGNVTEKKDALTESISEKKDALTESITGKKDAFTESIAEKKEALAESMIVERLSQLAKNSSFSQKQTMLHIKGFKKNNKSKRSKVLQERMQTLLKDMRRK